MNTEARSQVHQALLSRCHAIADHWYQAIARTSHVPHSAAKVRQRLIELTEQTIALLFTEPFERGQAEAIGASLAGLRYIEPEVLSQTQEILAQQLIEGLSADQVVALQPRLAELFGGLVAGYFEQARETILSEQEQTRGALTAALRQAKEAVQRAYEEVEQRVQERTAELRATNEALQREIAERKRAEEALRESEERFRGIFENATIGLYRTAPDGHILMANPTLVRMLGYSSFDELAQRNLEEEGYEPEYPRPAFKQRIESKGQVFGLESAWVRHDGTTLFVRESARAFRDEAENTLYYEGTVEDITERKRAEEALQESLAQIKRAKQEWESTADSLPQFVCLLDHQGRIIRANRIVERWNLGQVEDVKGQEVHELFHPGCTDPACYLESFWLRAWEELARGRSAECEAEDRVLKRHLRVQVQPILAQTDGEVEACDELSRVEGVSFAVVSVHDITERKRAEEALRAAAQQWRTTFDALGSVVCLLNMEGEILRCNMAMKNLLEKPFSEIIGRTCWELMHGTSEPIEGCPIVHMRETRRRETLVLPIGDRWFNVAADPLLDEDGRLIGSVHIMTDVTERKQAEESLRKAHDELEMRVRERTADLAQANEALRRERDLAEALAEAAAVVSSTLDPDQVLDRILEQASRVVPNDAANVMLIEDRQAYIARWRGYQRFGAEEYISTLVFHVPETPGLRQMRESREPMVIPDTTTYSGWIHVPEMEWLRSYAAAPIAVHGQVIGFLNVDSATPGFFTQAHTEALRAFADHAAAAIENARLFEQAQQEIAERRQAEESLKASEERYRSLFEGVPVGLYRTTPSGQILDSNLAAAQMMGYPDQKSLQTSNMADLYVNLEKRMQWQALMQREGIVRDFEAQFHRRDGTVIWVRESARAVCDADGRVLHYEGSVEDITERKRVEEDLRDREATMQALLNVPIESAILLDASGTILSLNDAAAQRLEKSADELIGLCVYDLLPPAIAKSRKAQVDRVFRSGAPARFEDEREGRCYDHSLHPILDARGKVARIAVYARDITHRKQAEERLLTYQARLRSLASQLSLTEERERRRIAMALHDRVGQTLAISKMKLGALRQLASSTELAEPLDEIHEFIEEIIRDTRSLTFELSSPILYQLGLEAALEWLAEQTQHRHGILSYFEDDGQPKPLDDDVRVLLFQAVRELLANVANHAQARSVKVAMRRDGGDVRIIVEDDGVGFDAFPIGPHWSEIKGFGLFSIRERLDHIGGQLKIVSTPGHGTQVTLVAPLKRVTSNQ